MKAELELAMSAAKNLPVGELRDFLVSLRAIELEALSRLVTPTPTTPSAITVSDDDPLDVAESAAFLGMSQEWIYKNLSALPPPERVGKGARPRIHFRRGDLRTWREQHKSPRKRR